MDKVSSIVSKHRIVGNMITEEGFMDLCEGSKESREMSHFLSGDFYLRLMVYQYEDNITFYMLWDTEFYNRSPVEDFQNTSGETMFYVYRNMESAIRAFSKRAVHMLRGDTGKV